MRAVGFGPVYDGDSLVLILGSFPSVKSRRVAFYYGNPQNRFWKTLCKFFGEEIPETTEGKRAFLLARRVALWDIVESCEIEGSSDASIREARIADVPELLRRTGIESVLCNGTTSYDLMTRRFPELAPLSVKLPSTSPANPRFSEEVWFSALARSFGKDSSGRRS